MVSGVRVVLGFGVARLGLRWVAGEGDGFGYGMLEWVVRLADVEIVGDGWYGWIGSSRLTEDGSK